MGRVSKHKKIKAMDPFYKGPRREPSKQDNLPPGSFDDDQPVPKALLRIVRSSSTAALKKTKPKGSSSVEDKEVVGSRAEQDELKFSRKEGESLNDYLDRIDVESRARLVELSKKSRGASERRKKYYEKRKKRLDKKGHKRDSEYIVEFKDLTDTVQFGEVVSAPPTLSAKPRGKIAQVSIVNSGTDKTESGPVVVGLKRKQDLKEEREKLIQRYRMAKKMRTDTAKKQ